MSARNCIAGFGVLCACALMISVFGVAPASATTMYGCVESKGVGSFEDSHCKTAKANGDFRTEPIPAGISKELSSTATAPFTISTTTGGVTFKVECTTLTGTGTATNELVAGAMKVKGEKITTELGGCKVVAPAGKLCVVPATIKFNELKAETTGLKTKYSPATGITIVTTKVSGCTTGTLNGTKEFTGSITGVTQASAPELIEFSATSGSELNIAGSAATFTGKAHATTKGTESTVALQETSFGASAYPATLSGNQAVQHAFAAGTKEIECTEAAFPGTLSSAATTITLSPEYSGCRTELTLPTTAVMNGCSYVLHDTGKTSIACPAGKKIQYHVYENEKKHLANEALCTISVPAQGPLGEVVYESEGTGSTADLLIKYKLAGIAYEVEGPKLQCGTSGSNGEYTGSSTEIAKNGKGEQIGWSLE